MKLFEADKAIGYQPRRCSDAIVQIVSSFLSLY